MYIEHIFEVRSEDLGAGSLISDSALLELMGETAGIHANLIRQGLYDREEFPYIWVLLGWRVHVGLRVPAYRNVKVRTWSRGHDRLFAFRDFEVFSEAGETLALATSRWMVLDMKKNFPARMTPEIMDPYEPETSRAVFPDYVFPQLTDPQPPVESSRTVPILRSMTDFNGHVHNTAYLDLADEIFPGSAGTRTPCDLEITYKKQAYPGETLLLEYARENGRHHALIRSADDRSLHALVTRL